MVVCDVIVHAIDPAASHQAEAVAVADSPLAVLIDHGEVHLRLFVALLEEVVDCALVAIERDIDVLHFERRLEEGPQGCPITIRYECIFSFVHVDLANLVDKLPELL